MIYIKTPEEIEIMKVAGSIASDALLTTLKAVKPGVTLLELDKIAETVIRDNKAEPSFMTVDGYKYTSCINVNDGIVHGLPNKYVLKPGDLVSIDLGALYKGYHSDLSYTLEVETTDETEFLETGKKALNKAIKMCKVGKRIGDISNAMQTVVESKGYSVSEMLVGHGIGKSLHEDPYVPCYGKPKTGLKLKEGMVFAVEIIYQKGMPDIIEDKDGWTLKTADGSLSGLFERTVAISKQGPILLTNY